MDLSTLSFPELQQFQADLSKEMKGREKTRIIEAKREVLEVAKRHGVSVNDILSTQVSKEPVAAKYADPDTGETWTGRGKRPNWLVQKTNQGHSLDEFKISKSEGAE